MGLWNVYESEGMINCAPVWVSIEDSLGLTKKLFEEEPTTIKIVTNAQTNISRFVRNTPIVKYKVGLYRFIELMLSILEYKEQFANAYIAAGFGYLDKVIYTWETKQLIYKGFNLLAS